MFIFFEHFCKIVDLSSAALKVLAWNVTRPVGFLAQTASIVSYCVPFRHEING